MNELGIYRELIRNFKGFACHVENASQSGMPDLVAVLDGITNFIEIKIDRPLLRPRQLAWINQAWTRGKTNIWVAALDEEFIWRCWKYPFQTTFTGSYHQVIGSYALKCTSRKYLIHSIFQCSEETNSSTLDPRTT